MKQAPAAIVIPVYKEQPDSNERLSFIQCLTVLKAYPFILACPASMSAAAYETIAQQHGKELLIQRFEDRSFQSIEGYNELLLSKKFYRSFFAYRFILIYQLDAYVFRDELEYWCQQGYDYIGAPWFENYGSHERGDELMMVGNGGFSLRNVRSVYDMLNYKWPLQGISYLYHEKKITGIRSWLILLLKVLGFHNNARFIIRHYHRIKRNEDRFLCNEFVGSKIKLKIPDVQTALKFSFDRSPAYLYGLNGYALPFGCHGWCRKDEVYTEDVSRFWASFIKTQQ